MQASAVIDPQQKIVEDLKKDIAQFQADFKGRGIPFGNEKTVLSTIEDIINGFLDPSVFPPKNMQLIQKAFDALKIKDLGKVNASFRKRYPLFLHLIEARFVIAYIRILEIKLQAENRECEELQKASAQALDSKEVTELWMQQYIKKLENIFPYNDPILIQQYVTAPADEFRLNVSAFKRSLKSLEEKTSSLWENEEDHSVSLKEDLKGVEEKYKQLKRKSQTVLEHSNAGLGAYIQVCKETLPTDSELDAITPIQDRLRSISTLKDSVSNMKFMEQQIADSKARLKLLLANKEFDNKKSCGNTLSGYRVSFQAKAKSLPASREDVSDLLNEMIKNYETSFKVERDSIKRGFEGILKKPNKRIEKAIADSNNSTYVNLIKKQCSFDSKNELSKRLEKCSDRINSYVSSPQREESVPVVPPLSATSSTTNAESASITEVSTPSVAPQITRERSSPKKSLPWYNKFWDKPWKRALVTGIGVLLVAGGASFGGVFIFGLTLTTLIIVCCAGSSGVLSMLASMKAYFSKGTSISSPKEENSEVSRARTTRVVFPATQSQQNQCNNSNPRPTLGDRENICCGCFPFFGSKKVRPIERTFIPNDHAAEPFSPTPSSPGG